jgi:alkanesulfonate monooxygenase SsuD/methylene tetrahydromethanopterin reductase-like flavin-dependent oxidoreductase (luciferase family)
MTDLGFLVQVQAGPSEALVGSAARAAEDAGYRTLWVNNPPGQDGLTPVAWAARSTTRLTLGSAVIPVSHHPPPRSCAA